MGSGLRTTLLGSFSAWLDTGWHFDLVAVPVALLLAGLAVWLSGWRPQR